MRLITGSFVEMKADLSRSVHSPQYAEGCVARRDRSANHGNKKDLINKS